MIVNMKRRANNEMVGYSAPKGEVKGMMTRKCVGIVLAAVFAVGLLSGGVVETRAASKVELVLGDTGSGPNSPLTISGTAWKNEIEKLSNGEITVKYFTQGQLGGERDMMEAIQQGTLDLYLGSTGVAGNFVPEMNVFNLPFLFLNRAHCEEVEFGPLGNELTSFMDKVRGLKGFAISGAGWRMPMNRVRAITKPEDFKGLKWRCMEIPLHMDTYRAMGASPIPMAFGELYTALQMGTVDGQENVPSIAFPMKFHEVCKHLSTLPVLLNGDVYVMNRKKWDGLAPNHQEIVKKAALVAAKALNDGFSNEDEKALATMEKLGVKVYRMKPSEMEPFVKATQAVWDKHLPQFSPRIREIALEIKKLSEKYKK
jgi:TRAP-type transport system periplasmic protein